MTKQPSNFPGLSAVILAAGLGTRMRSGRHKVLHAVAGRSLIQRVLVLAGAAGAERPVLVLGHQAEQVREGVSGDVRFVIQEPQLGTGHAVQVAAPMLREDGADRLLVLYGDCALLRPETLAQLVAEPLSPECPIVLLTAEIPDPTGYGRILRSEDGGVIGTVEEAEASSEQKQVREVWSGILVAWTGWVWQRLEQLKPRSKGEYYLPDLVNIALHEGRGVAAVQVTDADEVLGVNDRAQLARANAVLWKRACDDLMQAGVTILDPATTFIEPEVQIAPDVVIHPGCHIRGRTQIGSGSEIGPNTMLIDTEIGEDCRVWLSVLEHARIGNRVHVGPFSHLRHGAAIDDDVELGNYAEVKGSRLGSGTKMHHFSYVGDAELGERVNVGAGTITANFDGVNKHRTVVGDDAFIGSDSILRAPVRLGTGARTGAGSVVTHDIPDGETWAGVPARKFEKAPPLKG